MEHASRHKTRQGGGRHPCHRRVRAANPTSQAAEKLIQIFCPVTSGQGGHRSPAKVQSWKGDRKRCCRVCATHNLSCGTGPGARVFKPARTLPIRCLVSGAPYFAPFKRGVGYHRCCPLSASDESRVRGEEQWNPTSREKRARYGAPVLCEGTRGRPLRD